VGAQLLVVLLPAGALIGLGAAWVVFRASHGKSAWVRTLSVLVVLLACMVAPVAFFAALGAIAMYTQPKPAASVPHSAQALARLALALRPNPSLHPTAYSGLRPLPSAGELKR
jgi:hypothetical protein